MNRKLILSAALSGLMLTATAQTTVAPAIPRDRKIEKKVEALLKKMTLEEKIGQMTELTIDVITKRDNSTQEFQIDDALLDTVIWFGRAYCGIEEIWSFPDPPQKFYP